MDNFLLEAVNEAKKGLPEGGIPKVIVGENKTFFGAEDLLRSNGVEVTVLQDDECIGLMETFIKQNPDLWNEDIGESL